MDPARPSKRPSISPLQTLHSATSVVDERRNINRSLKICGFSTSRSAPTFPLSPVSPSCPPLKALPLELPELEIPPLSPPTTPLGLVDTKALSPSPLSTISSSHFDRPPSRSEPRPRRQPLRSHDDEFTPAWVRGQGLDKEGYCSRCDEEQWFKLKDGSYWYHRTFVHGISSISGVRLPRRTSHKKRQDPDAFFSFRSDRSQTRSRRGVRRVATEAMHTSRVSVGRVSM